MKKNNKKGFTLVELLAVIIVLALIMVFAVPSVLGTMNTARSKSLRLYAQRMVSKAEEYIQTQQMKGVAWKEGKQLNLDGEEMGLQDHGSYKGSVTVTSEDGVGYEKAIYTVHLKDETYCLNEATNKQLNGSTDDITIVSSSSNDCHVTDAGTESK